MAPIISINCLSKTYSNGFTALDNVSFDIAGTRCCGFAQIAQHVAYHVCAQVGV